MAELFTLCAAEVAITLIAVSELQKMNLCTERLQWLCLVSALRSQTLVSRELV